jgi:multidrug efflux pump subunit AcrB
MNIPQFALKNYQVSLVGLLLLVALGTMSLLTMPRSEDPQFDFPASMISVVLPGTNPVDMEKLVVDPIEQALNELDDIKVIRTDIEDGLAVTRIEFIYGTNPEDQYDDVVAAIARIRDTLPLGIQRLNIQKISPAEVNIMQLALQTEGHHLDYRQAQYWSEKLEKHLQRLNGVKSVEAVAIPQQQLTVRADLERMHSLNISMNQLIDAIESASGNIPAGHVNAGQRRFTVRSSGDFESLEQLQRTLVSSTGSHLVYVQDIAEVKIANAIANYLGKFNNKDAVFINVVQRKGSSVFDVTSGVKKALEQFQQQLPDELFVNIVHDQAKGVEKRINGFFENVLQGLLIVGVLSLLLLGLRAALVVVLAIPISVLIGIGWLDIAEFGLQQMSIVGLVIALGLLVDNAIVVTENVGRFIQQGMPPKEAAAKGAGQVAMAIGSGTLTTILAFFPILLLPSGSGTFLRSMPVTVIFVLIASLLIALTLTPLLASYLLKHKPHRKPYLQIALKNISNKQYRRCLSSTLRHPWLVMVLALSVFVGSLSLFPYIGVSLFPKAEKPALLINVELPEGASFNKTYELAQKVAETTADYEMVKSIAVNVGKGNPRIYYNVFPRRQVPNFAQLYVQLTHFDQKKIDLMITQMRKYFKQVPGAKIYVKEFQQGPPNEAPIEIRVIGDNIRLLKQTALDVESMLLETTGTVNVDNPISKNKIDVQIDINREKAALAGVRISNLDQTIRASLSGYVAGSYRDELGEDFPIMVRKAGSHEPTFDELQDIYISNQSGQLIPLKQLADIRLVTEIPRFQHHNLQRMVRVTSDVLSGHQTELVTNQIISQLENYDFPAGLSFSIGGEQENRKESFSGMSKAFLVALLGIFAVLVMQFRSFSQPLIIFAAIPFAISGAFIGLFIAGYTFSFTAFIGLTSLIGIVVNNSIILVDFANQLVEEGQSVSNAMIESAVTRLPPILLTTLTTVGGLLPLTLQGSGMWSPMGWSIIAGLLLSTLLTLFVIPVLYQWFTVVQKPVFVLGDE